MKSYYSVLFLKEFTLELLKNATPLYINEKIEQEKADITSLKEEIGNKVKEDFILKQENIPQTNKEIRKQIRELAKTGDLKGMQRSILDNKQILSARHFIPTREDINKERLESSEEIIKVYPDKGLYLGSIEKLINDHNVASIECPGPDKFISVHVRGRTRLTRIQMHKEDINEVLESFSREAHIPRIGGIFKAIVNNLVLTAIDTDVVGPRFIITKIHPQESMYL